MVNIRLYSFRKRLNSTAIPPDFGTTEQGELKDTFTLTGLSVKFRFSDPAQVPVYNYAYIVELSRYYFITDWYYEAGFWLARLAVDVLASNRADILASSQYVARSTSNFDASLIDTAYPAIGSAQHMSAALTPEELWGGSIAGNLDGVVVLGVISSSTNPIGAISYYVLSMGAFAEFMTAMLSSINWAGISASEISENLQKALINPTQYIVSCRWYPLNSNSAEITALPVVIGGIKLGWWSFAVSSTVRQIISPGAGSIVRSQELRIPKNLYQAASGWGRRAFMQLSPYSTYMLKFPPFGCFELDSTELYERDFLVIRVDANILTGDCTIKLTAYKQGETIPQANSAFFYYSGQFGVPLVIGQIAGDIGNYKNALLAGGVAGIAALSEVL